MLYTFIMDGKVVEKVEMWDEDWTLLGHAEMDFVKARLKEGYITKPTATMVFKVEFLEVDEKILINWFQATTFSGRKIVTDDLPLDKVLFIKTPPKNEVPEGLPINKREGFFIPAPDTERNAKAKARYFGARESSIWSAFDTQRFWDAVYESNMRSAMDWDDYNILWNPDVFKTPDDA